VKRLLAILATLFILVTPMSAAAAIYNPLGNACNSGGGVAGSDNCHAGATDPLSGPNGALMRVSLIISILGGIVAVIILLVASLMFVTSNGDPQKAASARSAVIGAVIGLVIIATAESIVIFVLKNV